MQNTIEEQRFGERPAGFSLPSVDGVSVSLESVIAARKGAVVIIWSNTCSHCLRYDEYLNDFPRRHPELGLLVLCSRQKETLEGLQKVVRQRKLSFPIAYDQDGVVAGQWYTRQTPRAFLLDATGALLYRGAIDNYKYPDDPEYIPYLEPAIRQFLNGEAIERQETASFGCAVQSVYYTLPKVL